MRKRMLSAAIAVACSGAASAFDYSRPRTRCEGTKDRIRLPVGIASAEALIYSGEEPALFQICRPGVSATHGDRIHARTRLAVHARTAKTEPDSFVELGYDTCVHLSAVRITAKAMKNPEDSGNRVQIDVCSMRE
jgi:hypothetical protein